MITQIEVGGLYGVFTHPIELKNENITLILGENGLGKTLILKMINAFFSKNFYELASHNFTYFILNFDDNTVIKVEKIVSENETFFEKEKSSLQISFKDNKSKKSKAESYTVAFSEYENKTIRHKKNFFYYKFEDEISIILRKYIPNHLERMGSDKWYDYKNEQFYSTKELIKLYNIYLPLGIIESLQNKYPEWLASKIESITTNLIETQRLLIKTSPDENGYRSSVLKYSQELVEIIKNTNVIATDLSSKLDKSYPNRVISQITKKSTITDDEIQLGLENLNKKRELLNKVGLLETNSEENIDPSTYAVNLKKTENKDLLKDVLQVYIIDSNKKLTVYDDLAQKLELLVNIINKRFLYKKMSIDKKEGFVFKSSVTDKAIPLSGLSSGEQHVLVLFYQLLFKTVSNSLLLIDEPEISLHITWQNHFIEDLREVIKLNDFSVIIATHSPDIINNNWDLTVQLNGI